MKEKNRRQLKKAPPPKRVRSISFNKIKESFFKKPNPSLIILIKTLGVVFLFCFIAVVIGLYMSSRGDADFKEINEIIETDINTELKMNTEMKAVSAYIRKVSKTKSKLISDYIAYSIITVSNKKNISIDLIVGLMYVESLFDPFAISTVGAKGLMQIYDKGIGCIKKTGKCKITFDQSKIFNVKYNIECGTEILIRKIDEINADRNKKKKYKRAVLDEALYRYVGGDSKYVDNVNKMRNEFVVFFIGFKTK